MLVGERGPARADPRIGQDPGAWVGDGRAVGRPIRGLAGGGVPEGTLRDSHRFGDGAYHDEHLHARLAADPEPTAPTATTGQTSGTSR
ncbi:hypothetical protein E4099_07255 [Streptomyces palmae]|uniref:Uncharacterized protein n=1 Tax=Streptomyces palmae TaxID=1701085 RepID=A0A4Z0HAJ5_9ACTN|nr:hypothetical protein E4099_07255 [Streptomyces palmae]